jgi:hypothetical protein
MVTEVADTLPRFTDVQWVVCGPPMVARQVYCMVDVTWAR